MTKFIILREDTDQPLMLPAAIAMITETHSGGEQGADKTTLQFAGIRNPRLLSVNAQAWNVTADAAADALAAAGTKMVKLPFVWGDKHVGHIYVNPAALTHICVSAPSQKDGEAEPRAGIIMSFRGGAFGETYAVPVSALDALLRAAAAANPALQRVEKEQATARWTHPGFVMHDPAEIVRVSENGYHGVDVVYRNGACSDFKLPRRDWHNEHLNNLFRRVVRLRGGGEAARNAVWTDKALMERISERCHRREERKRGGLQRAFAQAVAAGNPELVAVPGAQNVFYTATANIARIQQQGRDLYFAYNENTPEGAGMRDSGWARFADEHAARQGMKAIQRIMAR